jgi:hypothetical protein
VDVSQRAAENQALFREVNERLENLNTTFNTITRYGNWACECASVDCLERVAMTLDEYEQLRAIPTWFAVVPSEEHVVPEVERVVERYERYWVVEKLGRAAGIAVERDPRKSVAR